MIQITDLDFWYTSKHPVFTSLNLDLQKGKIHGILGLNGTGKSTLLKLIAGNLFAKNGTVEVQQKNISNRPVSLLTEIYFLPEEIEPPNISIPKYVNTHSSFYPQFNQEKFYKILSDFKVPENSKLNRLSFGQKKKFLIAFALSTNSKILIFDEPTNGLDIPSKSQFRKIIAREINDDQIMVISTHQVRDLGQMLDSVVILEQGKIIFNQEIDNIEQRLLFKKTNSLVTEIDSLYTEKNMNDYINILPNVDSEHSEIQLEVLFNAITENANLITEHFNN